MSNGNGRQTEPNKAEPEAPPAPTMIPGVAYFLVPQSVFTETIKILRKMPFENVEQVMAALSQCQPVKPNPATPTE